MSSLFPVSVLQAHMLELALLFFVLGLVILVRSQFTQDQHVAAQAQQIKALTEKLLASLDAQANSQRSLDELQEQCAILQARQRMVEKHGSEVQRIDLAMRLLKRGQADAATLRDLGLSNGEIKLLTQLHSPRGAGRAARRKATAPQTPPTIVASAPSESTESSVKPTRMSDAQTSTAATASQDKPVIDLGAPDPEWAASSETCTNSAMSSGPFASFGQQGAALAQLFRKKPPGNEAVGPPQSAHERQAVGSSTYV